MQKGRASRFDSLKAREILERICERMSGVVIECLPWQGVLNRYGGPDTLFYLDPPYYGTENYYQAPFKRSEFEEMADRLADLKGRFILSLNDCPEVREIFRAFKMDAVDVAYSLSRKETARGKRGELIISN